MKNLKVTLFDFKKGLDFEQSDISAIVESHMKAIDTTSEKVVIQSLNEKLSIHTYDEDVKSLLESLEADLVANELIYELKHLFKVVESRDNGMIYRQPLNVILDIIGMADDSERVNKILNELAMYDWVPEIKSFVYNLTENAQGRQNLLDSGKADSVYTVVETVEEGHICFLNDSWFLLTESSIDKVNLEDHIEDMDKLRTLRTLESALKFSEVLEDRINFKITENLVLGIGLDKKETFINEEAVNTETTLENLFSSPIIPLVKKSFFPVIKEVSENVDKFLELDVVKKINNIANPFKESFVFNYKDNVYSYSCDSRYGNSFFKYESAMDLITDIKTELGYDLTYFYEDKVSEEVNVRRRLEDKVREINVDIEDIDRNIDKVEANLSLLKESEGLEVALEMLKNERADKEASLIAVKESLYTEVTKK